MCLGPPALPPSLPRWKTPRIRRLKSSEGVHQGITIAECERCERCDLRKAAKRFLTIAEGERCCGKRSTNLTTKVLEGLFTSLTSLKSQISKQVSRRQMMFQALSNSRSFFNIFQEWLRCPVSAVALITEVLGCCSNFLEVERRLAESLGGPRLLQPFLGPRLLQPSKQLRLSLQQKKHEPTLPQLHGQFVLMCLRSGGVGGANSLIRSI